MSVTVRIPLKDKHRRVHMVAFTKPGTEASLCKVTTIKIKGRTFHGRRGGRYLCGSGTGKNTAAAKAARRAFTRTWGHRKHRRRR